MKNIFYSVMLTVFAMGVFSCKKDNYTAPDGTIQGVLTDIQGKAGLQLEQGSSSARLKLDEISYSSTPIPLYLNFKQDGSFINTKIFAAKYRVTPVEGPFYPIDSSQIQIVNVSSGQSTTANFKVVPYLNVDWVGDPLVGSDKKISVSFKFTRNPPPGTLAQPNLSDYQLFISTTEYVGNNNFDNTIVGGTVAANAAMEGQTLTISSSQPVKYSTTYFIRVGVRVSDSFKKYNYTTIKTVVVP